MISLLKLNKNREPPHALLQPDVGGEDPSRQVGSAHSSLATTGHGGHHARGDGGQGVGGWLGNGSGRGLKS